MREYRLEAINIRNPIYQSPIKMGGEDSGGRTLGITNYYLKKDGKPFFAVCGEAHFSRMNEALWEDEIIKMKMGGLNIIASYVFWIHHEEIEGEFDWTGSKNLRKFIELCKKNDMYVILRIGPFSHGECRNGGYPDWMFGRPFDIRCDDEDYLSYTKRFYQEIFAQAEGLLFKDGGPVIGVQLENEHEHASCPWEMTTENSKEWVVSGRNGKEHMATLKRLAQETGFDVPLYTATAWGGACAPEDTVFPLWGGYAFRPWMFYDSSLKEHPVTAEYLYGDFHCNDAPKYYNFDPEYRPEDFPYACCEMGGGMNVYYPYRFQLPYESVAAMSQVKTASGCNFLGYYMYHGGTHPKGKKVPYLNECAVPKFSYDYQAPLGEFGQVRKSYRQLKLQHLFYQEFTEEITSAKTVLSKEAVVQTPEDMETLRYAARINENGRGFLFLNNYQDHVEGADQEDFAVTLVTDQGEVRIPETGTVSLKKDANAILPIWFAMGSAVLKYATAQLVTRVNDGGMDYYIFAEVPGMHTEYLFENVDVVTGGSGCLITGNKVEAVPGEISSFTLTTMDGSQITVCTLPEAEAMRLWQTDRGTVRHLILSDSPVLLRDGKEELEYTLGTNERIGIFPSISNEIVLGGKELKMVSMEGIFCAYESYIEEKDFVLDVIDKSTANSEQEGILKRPVAGSPLTSTKIVNARAVINFQKEDFEGIKQLMIEIEYEGDVGYAFINGEMFHDNFCNGAPWEIDLMPYKDLLLKYGMYIYVSPKKKGAFVDNSSAMAARFEVAKEQTAVIRSVTLRGVKRVLLTEDRGEK